MDPSIQPSSAAPPSYSLSPDEERAYNLYALVLNAQYDVISAGNSLALREYLTALEQGNHFFGIVPGDVLYINNPANPGTELGLWIVSVNVLGRRLLVSELEVTGQGIREVSFDDLLHGAYVVTRVDKLHRTSGQFENQVGSSVGVVETVAPTSPATPTPAPSQETSAPATATSLKQEKVDVPALRQVFGKGMLQADDVQSIATTINQLLQEKSDSHAYEIAQVLVYLQQAGIHIKKTEQVSRMHAYLLNAREHMRRFGIKINTRYLTYLKYLGVIYEIDPVEQNMIAFAILDAANAPSHEQKNSLFFAQAKYLGMAINHQGVRKAITREVEHYETSNDVAAMLSSLSRLFFLGLDASFVQSSLQAVEKNVPLALNEYAKANRFDLAVRLSVLLNYIRGDAIVTKADRALLAQYVDTIRNASLPNTWYLLARYVALLSALARQAQHTQVDPGEFAYVVSEPIKDVAVQDMLRAAAEAEKQKIQRRFQSK